MASALDEIRLVIVGRTGSGKSSLGNALIGRQDFDISDTPAVISAKTEPCKRAIGQVDDKIIHVIDTPGTIDTPEASSRNGYDPLKDIAKSISFSPNGVNAFLLVMRLDARPTQEEIAAIQNLKTFLGDTFISNYGIVVFTHADCLGNDEVQFKHSIEGLKQTSYFRNLLMSCNYRVVMMDTSTNCNKQVRSRQKQKLMEIVKTINDGRLYVISDMAHAMGTGDDDVKKVMNEIKAQQFNFLIVGSAGSGKSSLANSLMETDGFQLTAPNHNWSSECQKVTKFFMGHNTTVIDSPGDYDANQWITKVRKAAQEQKIDEFHSVLIVANITDCFRFDQLMRNLESVLGPDVYTICTIVFTHGDTISNDTVQRERKCTKALQKLCLPNDERHGWRHRFLLIDSTVSEVEKLRKMDELRQMVNTVNFSLPLVESGNQPVEFNEGLFD